MSDQAPHDIASQAADRAVDEERERECFAEAIDSDPSKPNWLMDAIKESLRLYTVANHGGVNLVDVLTAPGEQTVATGSVEMELLADALWLDCTDALTKRYGR